MKLYTGETLEKLKQRLLLLLPGMPYNKYIAEEVKKSIEEA